MWGQGLKGFHWPSYPRHSRLIPRLVVLSLSGSPWSLRPHRKLWNVRPSYSVLRPSFFSASSWNKDFVGWGRGATDALPLFSVPVAGRVVLHCSLCVSAVGCSAEAEALLAQFPFLSPVAVAVTLLARSDAFTQFLKHSWANLSVFNSHLGDP